MTELNPGDVAKLQQIANGTHAPVRDLFPSFFVIRGTPVYEKRIVWKPRSRWVRAQRWVGRQVRRIPIRVVWVRREERE